MKGKGKYLIYTLILIVLLGYNYKYATYKIELLGNYDKILAHRVNSIDKLSSALKYFKGVELDLVYFEKEDCFDVNHPPAESIDLKLENYLGVLKDDKKPFLWLDIKNLTEGNSRKVLDKLLIVFSKINYPLDKILVETHNPNTLPIFSDAGFKTSYYLPYGLCKMGANELNTTIGSIKNVLSTNPDMAISSDIQDYQILDVNFPNKIKYTWVTGSVFRNNFFLAQKALRDPKVGIVLVTYNAPKGNR